MPKYFYTDENGQKQGPFDTSQDLKTLVSQGIITRETVVENALGKTARAGALKSLFPEPPQPPQRIPAVVQCVTISVACPNKNCQRKFRLKGEHAGRTLNCPTCRTGFVVPTIALDTATSKNHAQDSGMVTINVSTITILWIAFGISGLLTFSGLFLSWFIVSLAVSPVAIVTLILAIKEPNRLKGTALKEKNISEPNNCEAAFELGVWYLKHRDWDDAKQYLEKAVTLGHIEAKSVLEQCTDANYWEKYQCGFSNIFEAAEKGTIEDVRYFLEKKGRLDSFRPILRFVENTVHMLAKKDRFGWGQQVLYCIDDALYLVDKKGVNVNTKDSKGRTPLDVASTEDIKRVLQDAGGKPGPGLPPLAPKPQTPPVSVCNTSTAVPFSASRGTNVRQSSSGTGCYHHPSQQAATQCKKCGKGLCRDCYNVYGVQSGEYAGQALCYDCTEELVVESIANFEILKERVKWERIWIVIGMILGSFIGGGIYCAGGDQRYSFGVEDFLTSLILGAGIGGSLGTIIIGSIWIIRQSVSERGDGNSEAGCLIGIAILVITSPIISIFRLVKRFRQIANCNNIIASDERSLREMRDYFAYTQAMEDNTGTDLAKLASQGSELYDNTYAKAVLSRGEQAAQAELRRSVVQIAENGEIIRSYNQT